MDPKAIELLRRLTEIQTGSEYYDLCDEVRAYLQTLDQKEA